MNRTISAIFLLTILFASTLTFAQGHHGAGVITKVNYDSLFNEAQPLAKSDAGQKVISNCIDAYGGKAHLENLKSYHLTHDASIADTMIIDRYFKTGRKYNISYTKSSEVITRALNGNESWTMFKDSVIIFESKKHNTEIFSYMTLSMPLAMTNEPFSEIRYGTRTDDDYNYVYCKKSDTLMIITAIDPENNYIKKVEGILYYDAGQIVYINKFFNHNTYDGYVFADSLVNISMGLEVRNSILTNVEINPILPETLFNHKKNAELR